MFGVFGEFSAVAGDGGDAEAGFGGVADDDFIAGGVDGEAEDIVAAGDVGDGCGGEDSDFLFGGHGGVSSGEGREFVSEPAGISSPLRRSNCGEKTVYYRE